MTTRVATRRAAAASLKRRGGRATGFFNRGGYEGARVDIRELMAWTPGLGSADSDTLSDLPALRARSRDAERNQPIASGALLTKLDNIVGSGLQPSSQIDREFLGLTEAQAEEWERNAERIVYGVAGSTNFDVARRQTFFQMQRLALRTTLSSGDCFAVRRYIPRAGDILALKVQLLEADRCANPPEQFNSDRLRDGVALDAFGAPRGYWFASHQPGEFQDGAGMPTYTFTEAFGKQTGMPFVLHVYEQLRPGQSRGVPMLATVLRQLKQLDRYTDSELAAAVVASFFTVFVKSTTPIGEDDDSKSLASLTDPETEALVDAGTPNIALGQGAVVGLPPDKTVETANPGRPNAQFDPFVTSICRVMGVALGIPYELLLKTFKSSYSASRAALLEAWRTFEAQQDWLVATFCQPVYEWIITEAVARGLLHAPGFEDDALIRMAYLRSSWTGPTVSQLDPLKEVNAAIRRIEAGLSSRAVEAPQLTGQDWFTVHQQQVKERARRVADGLDPKEIIVSGKGSMVVLDDEDTIDDDAKDDDSEDADERRRNADD